MLQPPAVRRYAVKSVIVRTYPKNPVSGTAKGHYSTRTYYVTGLRLRAIVSEVIAPEWNYIDSFLIDSDPQIAVFVPHYIMDFLTVQTITSVSRDKIAETAVSRIVNLYAGAVRPDEKPVPRRLGDAAWLENAGFPERHSDEIIITGVISHQATVD